MATAERKEKSIYRKLFDEMDQDGSGSLDETNLHVAIARMFPDMRISLAQIQVKFYFNIF